MTAPNPRLVERQLLAQIDTINGIMVEREVLADFHTEQGNRALAYRLAAMAGSAERHLALVHGNYLAFRRGQA